MTVTTLKRRPAKQRTPAREALAKAIAELRTAKARHREATAALSAVDDASMMKASAAVEAAAREIEAATKRAGLALAGGVPQSGPAVAEARLAWVRAQDDAEALRTAKGELRAAEHDADRAAHRAEAKLERAVEHAIFSEPTILAAAAWLTVLRDRPSKGSIELPVSVDEEWRREMLAWMQELFRNADAPLPE